jgi:hypothetical protein
MHPFPVSHLYLPASQYLHGLHVFQPPENTHAGFLVENEITQWPRETCHTYVRNRSSFRTKNTASWPILEFKQHGQHEAQERHLILFTLLTPP